MLNKPKFKKMATVFMVLMILISTLCFTACGKKKTNVAPPTEPQPVDIVAPTLPSQEEVEQPKPTEPAKVPYETEKENIEDDEKKNDEKKDDINKEETKKEEEKKSDDKQKTENKVSCFDADEYLYVSASVLNVRLGPGTDYKSVDALKCNTKVHRIGICENGWSKIKHDGEDLYVSSNYLKDYKTVDETLYVSASCLNVRKGPNTSSSAIGSLAEGDKVRRVGICDNGWSKIIYGKQEAYVYSDYLTYVYCETTDEYLYITATALNVRTGPGTSYKTIVTLNQNTQIHRVGVCTNGWSKIYYYGKTGYVFSEYLGNEKVEETRVESIGKLEISSFGFEVSLFSSESTGMTNQEIVNECNGAVYMYRLDTYGYNIIADKASQGFSAIKNAVPESTKAKVTIDGETKEYVCTKVFVGYNTTNDLTDADGETIRWKNDGGLCMYTSNSDGTITIVFWQPV